MESEHFNNMLLNVSIYNNRILKMCGHARGLRGRTDGRTDGRATVGRGRHGRQAASADRLRAGIEGSAGGEQSKIAMSRHRRGLRGRTDGRAGTGNPAAAFKGDAILSPLFLLFMALLNVSYFAVFFTVMMRAVYMLVFRLLRSDLEVFHCLQRPQTA